MKAITISIGLILVISAGTTSLMVFRPGDVSPRLGGPIKASLRLNGPFEPSHAGEMVAARLGLFVREGAQIDLRAGTTDADAIALVASGKDTIGVVGADQFLLAREKDVPVVAFAAAFVDSPVVFYTLEGSGIRAPTDFGGKRVGYQAGRDTAFYYDEMMLNLQLPQGMVRRIAVGSDFAPFVQGDIDVWPGHIASESYDLNRIGIRYNSISPASYGVHVPGTVYFALEKTIKENPDLIRRILQAVVEGWEVTYSDYTKSAPLIASFDPGILTPDLIRFKLEQQRALIRPFATRVGEFDEIRWQSLQRILLHQKLLKEPLDLSKALSYQFLRDVYRRSLSHEN